MWTAVATGQSGDEDRAEARRSLIALLEHERWGNAQNQALAASAVVQQLFDQAKLQAAQRQDLDTRQRQAISGLARELTRQLMRMAKGMRGGRRDPRGAAGRP